MRICTARGSASTPLRPVPQEARWPCPDPETVASSDLFRRLALLRWPLWPQQLDGAWLIAWLRRAAQCGHESRAQLVVIFGVPVVGFRREGELEFVFRPSQPLQLPLSAL